MKLAIVILLVTGIATSLLAQSTSPRVDVTITNEQRTKTKRVVRCPVGYAVIYTSPDGVIIHRTEGFDLMGFETRDNYRCVPTKSVEWLFKKESR